MHLQQLGYNHNIAEAPCMVFSGECYGVTVRPCGMLITNIATNHTWGKLAPAVSCVQSVDHVTV